MQIEAADWFNREAEAVNASLRSSFNPFGAADSPFGTDWIGFTGLSWLMGTS